MSRKKFKRKLKKFKEELTLLKSLPVEPKQTKSEILKEKRKQFPLSDEDRLTYIYKTNKDGVIKEITCVSYEIFIKENWITIVYFDNVHSGVLHRHLRVSMDDESDPATTLGVTAKTDCKKQLTWAIHNITKLHLDYRNGFLKRSKKYLVRNKLKIY